MSSICSRPHPVPKVHKYLFRKEVEPLVLLGVLELEKYSEWGAPYFAQTKPKSNQGCFLSDFWKTHPMPKINEMLLKLEGFYYATSLDLNMGYYHIRFIKNASKLCTIILSRGKCC